MKRSARTLIVSLGLCSTSITALAEVAGQCFQSSLREKACPHMIYKAFEFEKVNGDKEKKVACICVSDFEFLLKTPQSKVDKDEFEAKAQLAEKDTGLTRAQLIDLMTK